MTAEDPVLVCEGVSYVYADGTRANEDIDLTLRRGELFCLLGPNGAGKTTLIRQITTDLRPKRGRISLFGEDAHADPIATKRRLGVIPQTAGLFEMLRVEDHLQLFGPLKHLSRAETRVQVELKNLSLAQLAGYLDRIETAPQLLSIKSLRIRSRADKPELLDATVTVSSFEPAAGQG